MILVTGATGLVGSHLILTLLENHPAVRAICRTEISKEKTKAVFQLYNKESLFKNIQWIQADITDVPSLDAAFESVEYVYHCAGLISFNPKDEEKLRKVNIEGTANIVNFCIDHQVKKLCFVSSIAALGDLKEHETLITENTEWNPELPHSDYAISKYGAEMEVWRGQQEGLNVIIVNPGIILGPGFWTSGSGQLFSRVKNGMFFYTRGTTGYISVNDVVKCLIHCMESVVNGERYCLVAENYSFEYILNIVATALKAKPPKIFASREITALAWRFDYLLSAIFQRERSLTKLMVRSLHQKAIYSNEKIKSCHIKAFENIADYISVLGKLYPNK